MISCKHCNIHVHYKFIISICNPIHRPEYDEYQNPFLTNNGKSLFI